jgi:regulator of protease activity HflC (stomatin/prohibitin superfamily)
MQRKLMARIPRPNLKAVRPPALAVKRPSLELPRISTTTAYVLLPVLTVIALVLGFIAGSQTGALVIGAAVGIGIVVVATSLIVGMLLSKSVIAAVAPLFMTRYGTSERQRAQDLVESVLSDSSVPVYRVVEGMMHDDMNPELARQFGGGQNERRRELFKTVGQGPARLYVDQESAVLVEREGKFIALHAGMHDLTFADRVKGIAHLRPQREPIDFKSVLTHDMVGLDIRGGVTFQIKQDARHLEQTQSHYVEVEVLRRALLPRDEWKTRTKSQIALQINAVLRECDLWQLYLSPPKLPAPGEISTLYTLGQAVLPSPTRLELEQRIKQRLNDVCWKWGVEVIRVTFEQVTPPKDLTDAAHRTYLAWNQVNEQVLEAERQAQTKLRLAQVEFEEMRLHKETELLHAQTDKQKEIMQAEGDAAAYEMRMKARADGALEFARRIETLRQAMGNTLDEGTFRELLRALDLLREDEREEFDREGYSRLVIPPRMGRKGE